MKFTLPIVGQMLDPSFFTRVYETNIICVTEQNEQEKRLAEKECPVRDRTNLT